MPMIRAVLLDDEPKNTDILVKMLAGFCPEVEVAGVAQNPEIGYELIQKARPDLVFLDIEMPYGNAFDLLDKLKPIDFEVIFVTAFDNYMLKAFKYSALDYLLKPVDIGDLKSAVDRAIERRKAKTFDMRQLELLVSGLRNPRQPVDKLAFPSKEGLVFHEVADIIRFEGHHGYTYIFLKSGQKIISTRKIKEYEEILPETEFFRVHNSHLVSLRFIRKYHKGRGGHIEMTDGTVIEVATRRRDELLSRFGHGTV